MHEHEGLFCKTAILWIMDKIADLGKKLHGPKLAGPTVHRRGLGGCSHRATGLEAKKRLGFGRLGRLLDPGPRQARQRLGRSQRARRGAAPRCRGCRHALVSLARTEGEAALLLQLTTRGWRRARVFEAEARTGRRRSDGTRGVRSPRRRGGRSWSSVAAVALQKRRRCNTNQREMR